MTKTQDLDALVAQGLALPAQSATKKQFLQLFANLFGGRTDERLNFGDMYKTISDVEYLDEKTLSSLTTVGTALQPVVDALNVRGYATESNVGSLMRTTKLTQGNLHDLVCYCHGGSQVLGQDLERRFTRLANAEA
jgi:hypothetical protein